jgi:hypothetical protein
MKDLLISHISDIDGVSPVILLKLTKVEFDYILKEPHEMDEFVEELLKEDLNSYQNIYITDLALSENFYKKIKESGYAYKFKIFDHHKTHLFAKNYENVVIDIEECGTTLFYNYLSKKYKFKRIVEDYIKHVKNLDLWLWVEKFDFMAKELGNIFDLYGRNTYIEEMYQKLKRGKKFKWNKFENKILKIEKDTVDRYLKKKDKELYKIEYDGYLIGAVFSERYRSELGNYLSSIHPELDLVVMINMSGGLSLRTEKDIDISILAQKLNGGGHKKACGAPIEEEVKESILKNIFKDCKIKEIPE